MTDFPERISISPVHRQKRWDDFYLVDREAFPGKGKEYVRGDIYDAVIAELQNVIGYLEGTIEDGCPKCGGDCSSANPPVQYCPMQIMRADLEKAQNLIKSVAAKP